MIKTKLVNNDHLRACFAAEYLLQGYNLTTLDYLRKSKTRIFYKDSEDHLMAGYCINPGPDYRTFIPLNSFQVNQLLEKEGFKQKPPSEISCLWIDSSLRREVWVIYFFFILFIDLIKSASPSIIFGTHAKNIKNYFTLAFPKIIFSERMYIKTKDEECDFWIMKGSLFSFFRCLILLSTVRVFLGTKMLSRFRRWTDK